MSRGPPKAYHEQTKKNRRTLGFVGIFSVIVVYWDYCNNRCNQKMRFVNSTFEKKNNQEK